MKLTCSRLHENLPDYSLECWESKGEIKRGVTCLVFEILNYE